MSLLLTVVELIKVAGRKAVALPADIRTEAACRKLVTDAVSKLGGLDIPTTPVASRARTPSWTSRPSRSTRP
ncbi:hypothetical protein [Corallococcus terminator]|uniref:hypothetical protein n=1 Tax=Corallococcus terminator TaxID=2316733 RepID=UPI001FC94034|nr:hypothetical protein [Corallococcus terminator]